MFDNFIVNTGYESEMQDSKENDLDEEKEQDNKHNTNKKIGKGKTNGKGRGKKNIKYKNNNNNNNNNNNGFIEQGNIGSDDEYQTDYDDDEKGKENDVMPLTGLHVSVTPAEPKGQTSSLLKDRTGVSASPGGTSNTQSPNPKTSLKMNQNEVSAQI